MKFFKRKKPTELQNLVAETMIQASVLINMQDEEIKRLQRHCELLEAMVASSYKPPQDVIDAVCKNNKMLSDKIKRNIH